MQKLQEKMLSKDEMFLLATKLDLQDLLNFCSINKKMYKDVNIWNYKINEEFPDSNNFRNDLSSKDKYILLKSLKNVKEFLKRDENIYALEKSGFDLRDINLNKITPYLGNLQNIEYLYFQNCYLNKIPKSFSNLKNLTTLNLSENRFEEIPDVLFSLKNLERLYLDNNEISNVSHKLGNLTKLKYLDLSNNEIEEIPDSIGNLSNLENFYLEDNLLTKIPNSIGNLSKLVNFYLWRNSSIDKILDLPNSLKDLPNLETIKIDRFTKLTKLSFGISNVNIYIME